MPNNLNITEANTFDTSRKEILTKKAGNFLKRPQNLAATTLAVCAGAGLVGAVENYRPDVPVSSTSTEFLIEANDGLRYIGPSALAATLLLGAGLQAGRRKNIKLDASFQVSKPYETSSSQKIVRRALPAFVIAAAATSSGIGDTASGAANNPVNFLQKATGANEQNSALVLQHRAVVPFNASQVSKIDVDTLQLWANLEERFVPDSHVKVTPFDLRLGSLLKQSNGHNNPSSSSIVALPEANIKRATGVSLHERSDGTMPVIVGDQLAKTGDTVLVEQKPATVVATTDKVAGLDRVATIGSLETLSGEILKGDTYSGAVVTGVNDPEQLQAELDILGIDASAVSLSHFKNQYNDFWDHSVKPVEMQLILFLVGIGVIAASYIRINDTLKKRQNLALLNAQGVDKKSLQRAESLRAFSDSASATILAVPGVYLLTTVTNSSQYGLDQAVDAKGIGAGLSLWLAANAASGVASSRFVKKMDSADELRT